LKAVGGTPGIAVTVMGLVAALAIHAAVDNKLAHLGNSGGLANPDISQAEQVLTVITISLVTLAALAEPGAGERVRTASLPFIRSTASCTTHASCTDDTGHRAGGFRPGRHWGVTR